MTALEDDAAFLRTLHGAPVEDLEPLTGGFWSRAYGYRVGADELVARFGEIRAGFEADRRAMAYASPDLPVPEVLDIGDAFGAAYAISRRARGRFLEELDPSEAERAAPMLRRLLDAIRAAPPVPGESFRPWREWLLASLADDDPGHPTAGWRRLLAARPDADRTFRACEARIVELLPDCPDRGELVHGDLLHRNVLIDDDASAVTAVFSWKCAGRGDALYDAAWCTFWGDTFHPGIAAVDVRALVDADPVRHHCYELHIGATHLGWNAWTGDDDSLERVRLHLDHLYRKFLPNTVATQ